MADTLTPEQLSNKIGMQLGFLLYSGLDQGTCIQHLKEIAQDYANSFSSEKDKEIQALKESKWISVKQQPETSMMCLILVDSLNIYIASYKKNLNLFTAYGVMSVEITDFKTTHWQPLNNIVLPEQPKI